MTPVVVVPVIALAALVASCCWVWRDAKANVDAGTPVILDVGGLRIDTPETWALGCLVVVVLFLPLYLAARNTSFTGRW